MESIVVNNNVKKPMFAQRFGLYIAFASIMMMFASLTSAYIVRKSAGNWLEFKLPSAFLYSSFVILLSSVTLHMSYTAFKKNNFQIYKLFLLGTFALGLMFVMFQFQGWQEMQSLEILLDGNPSGSFVYVISGVHLAHVIGGLTILMIACIHAYRLKPEVTSKRLSRFQLTTQYWHFVGLLWIYLYIFFLIQ